MLSDDLACLAAQFREHEYDGVTLTPEDVRRVAAVLSQAALDAGALERLTVPAAARLDPEAVGGNVLALPARAVPLFIDSARVPRDPEPAA